MMVSNRNLLSRGVFSGAMLVSGRVIELIALHVVSIQKLSPATLSGGVEDSGFTQETKVVHRWHEVPSYPFMAFYGDYIYIYLFLVSNSIYN